MSLAAAFEALELDALEVKGFAWNQPVFTGSGAEVSDTYMGRPSVQTGRCAMR